MFDLDALAALHTAGNPEVMQAMGGPGGVQGLPTGEQPYKLNFMDRLRTMPNFNVKHGFKGIDMQDRMATRFAEINAKRAERGLPPIGEQFLQRWQGRTPTQPTSQSPGVMPGAPSPTMQAPAGGGNALNDLWSRVKQGFGAI